MKTLFNFLLWAGGVGCILGAYLTQIPFLVTIATVIYWIVSIGLPVLFTLLLLCFLVAPEQAKEGAAKAWNKQSTLSFIAGSIKSFITLGVYATVGWAWPFAMTMIAFVMIVSVRFNNKETD